MAKKIFFKNYKTTTNPNENKEEIPEWLAKSIVSVEQKIGKIRNDVSGLDKQNSKKKKKNTNIVTEKEELTRLLDSLNLHKDKWSEIGS